MELALGTPGRAAWDKAGVDEASPPAKNATPKAAYLENLKLTRSMVDPFLCVVLLKLVQRSLYWRVAQGRVRGRARVEPCLVSFKLYFT
jgi:hypothetical protein